MSCTPYTTPPLVESVVSEKDRSPQIKICGNRFKGPGTVEVFNGPKLQWRNYFREGGRRGEGTLGQSTRGPHPQLCSFGHYTPSRSPKRVSVHTPYEHTRTGSRPSHSISGRRVSSPYRLPGPEQNRRPTPPTETGTQIGLERRTPCFGPLSTPSPIETNDQCRTSPVPTGTRRESGPLSFLSHIPREGRDGSRGDGTPVSFL